MKPFKANANPRRDISPCALDHSPKCPSNKAWFNDLRERILDENVSYDMSESDIEEMAPLLAQMRIDDANKRAS